MRTAIKVLLTLFLVLLLLAGAVFYSAWWYENNVDRSGWTVENGVYSYKDFYGDPVTGWQEIDGSIYYFFPLILYRYSRFLNCSIISIFCFR